MGLMTTHSLKKFERNREAELKVMSNKVLNLWNAASIGRNAKSALIGLL